MRRIFASTLSLLSVLMMSSGSHARDAIPIPDGSYLGQMAPDSTAEVFAPGIFNTRASEEKEGMFVSDMNTFYFVRGDRDGPLRQLIALEYKNNQRRGSVVIDDRRKI